MGPTSRTPRSPACGERPEGIDEGDDDCRGWGGEGRFSRVLCTAIAPLLFCCVLSTERVVFQRGRMIASAGGGRGASSVGCSLSAERVVCQKEREECSRSVSSSGTAHTLHPPARVCVVELLVGVLIRW